VAVTAPAGYGKTTLLTQWPLAEDRPVAWVSLNRFDDDPGALLALLATAFARAVPGHASRATEGLPETVTPSRHRRRPACVI
jgi:LuxR family maltose regulon positive regulatory protein